MNKEELIKEYDDIISSDTIDLERADNLKSALSGVFDELTSSQKDISFYTKQIDDLKRQNRALYLRTNPTVEVEQPNTVQEPQTSPFERFSACFDDKELTRLF